MADVPPPQPSRRRRLRLLSEYALLYFGLPTAYVCDLVPLPLIPALWLLSAACLAVLLAASDFDRSALWNAHCWRRRLAAALLPVAVAIPALLGITLALAPERLFGFVRTRPLLWAVVMVLYPLLSVYPQGIVYRVFVFPRYRPLFPGRAGPIVASALAFSVVHVVFENWIAPLVSLPGGLLFAWTYDRTRSSLVAAAQHAALGCALFTVGLGRFFYHGGWGT